jgi:hypothetical protein
MSEQIWGYPVGCSLERFLTIDYAIFIPINQQVSAGT